MKSSVSKVYLFFFLSVVCLLVAFLILNDLQVLLHTHVSLRHQLACIPSAS